MAEARFYRIKDEVRILGVDDGPFSRTDKDVIIVGTVFRGGTVLDGILTTKVRVDGLNSTKKLSEMVSKCKFKDLRVIMLDGLGFGGFNLLDIEELNRKTGLPVIVVVRKSPDFGEIESALNNLPNKRKRMDYIRKAGTPMRVETRPGKFVYVQTKGISLEDAGKIVRLSSTRSNIPEPLRVAHLIASGVTLGESRGNA